MNVFIVNPKAGNGKSIEFAKAISFFMDKDADSEIIYTKYKNHATDIAFYYSHSFPNSTIYSVGGDGTLNEVVNGISEKAKLCVIPVGSGNDFYKVISKIEGTTTINIGIVNGRKFANIASIGLDAKIASRANEIKESKTSFLPYPRAIIESVINYEPDNIIVDGKKETFTLLAICNGMYYGSGIPINPNYDLNNDFLNIICTEKLTRKQTLLLFYKLSKGLHIESSKVKCGLRKCIKINSQGNILCNVDGEIINGDNFEFKIIENGLTVTSDIPQYVKKAINRIN